MREAAPALYWVAILYPLPQDHLLEDLCAKDKFMLQFALSVVYFANLCYYKEVNAIFSDFSTLTGAIVLASSVVTL